MSLIGIGTALGQLGNDIGKGRAIARQQALEDFKAKLEERQVAIAEAQEKATEERNKLNDQFRRDQFEEMKKYHARMGKPDLQTALDEGAKQLTGDMDATFDSLSAEDKEAAKMWASRRMGVQTVGAISKSKIQDPNSPTGWSWAWYNTISNNIQKIEPGAPASNDPNAPVSSITWKTQTDAFGNQSLVPVLDTKFKGTEPPKGAAKPITNAQGVGSRAAGSNDVMFRSAADMLRQGSPWVTATKGWKPGAVAGFQQWLTKNNIKLPATAYGKSGSTADAIAGLDVLESTMFNSQPEGAMFAGSPPVTALADAVGVLDEHHTRLVQLWPILQGYVAGNKPGGVMAANVLNLAMQTLTPEEIQYVTAMNQAVSSINGLRKYMGNPRYTEALAKRFISELPDPVTTPDAKSAQVKLARIRQELEAARARLASGEVTGGQVSLPTVQPPQSKIPSYHHDSTGRLVQDQQQP